MAPSGPPNPVGGSQSVPGSLLRSSSTILGGTQAGSMPSQQPFSSFVSPRTQFNNSGISNSNNGMGLLGNMSNVSSLVSHSFGNGGPVSGGALTAPNVNLQQRGGVGDMLGSTKIDPLSFASSTVANQGQHFQNPSGNQLVSGHSQPEQLECMQSFQRQFSLPHNQQQAQLRGGLGNVGSMAPIKFEHQMGPSDKNGHRFHNIGAVKLEPQQMQSVRSLGPVKLERQHSDSTLFLQQQQQQQMQMLQMPRHQSQSASAHISLLQQQRILQLQQQQQQQQIIKNLPHQRNQLHQKLQQVPVRPQAKPTLYEPGMCARRLTHYMYQQQHRPEDNHIGFWRKFVADFFAPNAKKRWCVSMYGSSRQTTGVFPQDAWHCEICNRKPGRGFETTVEVLPRLLQIKYASGTMEELLYVDMPREYQNASGQIVLDYAKAIQESVFDQLRVVREGQMRIVFSPDLKICSWEFCARRHEEIIPRRILMPQVSQLGSVVQKYQNATQNASSTLSAQDLQSTCNVFVASARQLAKALEVPLVNDLGYTKRYVRCLQISEVVNCMKDLIDYSRETGTGPMDSLIHFPRRNTISTGQLSQQGQQTEGQQSINQNPEHNDQSSVHVAGVLLSSSGNGMLDNSSINYVASSCTTTSMGNLHQNSMNIQENKMSNVNGPYGGGNAVQISSASSSNSLPPSQPNGSPFPSPTPSSSNLNSTQLNSVRSPANMSTLQQPSMQSHDPDPTETQSSVQRLQEMIMTSQLNGVDNSLTPSLSGGNRMVGNSMPTNSGAGGMGFGTTVGMVGPSAGAAGLRAAMENNMMAMNMRGGMNHVPQNLTAMNHQQQQEDIGNRLLGDLSQVDFSNLQFDWKPSP